MSKITLEQIGDPATFLLSSDLRVVFGDGPIPVGTLVKAMEMGLRITVQGADGESATFWAPTGRGRSDETCTD